MFTTGDGLLGFFAVSAGLPANKWLIGTGETEPGTPDAFPLLKALE